MRAEIQRIFAACAAIAFWATPALATSVSLRVVGQDLQVLASSLGADTVTAWDIDIAFNNSLLGNILGMDSGNQLGLSNVNTVFGFTTTSGLIDAFEISLLTNSQIDAIQNTDPIVLARVHFDSDADLSIGNFVLANWGPLNQVICAGPGDTTVVCYSGNTVPEPTSLALLTLALIGGGVCTRRFQGVWGSFFRSRPKV
jgi:hypothetical protein